MSRVPRLLPLVAIAIGGVLAVKGLTEAPQLYLASRALAEDVVSKGPPKPPLPLDASILTGGGGQSSAPKPAPPACAPTAAELAKEAGLSPAELQVLQSLSDRRGQLDQRESSLDVQVQLIAAAEAKLDGRIQQMNGLKSDIQALLGQADQQAQAEADRLVHIYEDMDPKKAAAALALMDDSVRLPIAAKMKERKLADILGKMDPADAKALTEKLAARTAGSKVLADAKTALNPAAAPAPTPAPTPPPAAANAKPAKPAAAAPADDAQVGQTGQAPAAGASAKPHKVARAAPKPRPKPKPSKADADVADAMNPPGGVVMPGARPAAPKAPAKVASAARPPVGAASAAPKPAAPPLPASAKPG